MRKYVLFFLFAVGTASACGGSLKYRLDDGVLADVPMSEKNNMLGAKSEMDRTAEEMNKARADLETSDRDLSVARAEYTQAKASVAVAQANLDRAKQSQDLNQINPAKEQYRVARLGQDAAGAKVDWRHELYRQNKQQVRAAELHQRSAQARYELEKARLAQASNKRPTPDFNVTPFEQQALRMQQDYDQAKIDVNQIAVKASMREQRFNMLQGQYTSAAGQAPPAQPTPGLEQPVAPPSYQPPPPPPQGYQPPQGYPPPPPPGQTPPPSPM